MKNKFLLGAVAGMATLGMAVPILAQVGSAATSSADTNASAPVAAQNDWKTRPPLTQAAVQDMITHDDAFLANIDAFVVVQKNATQAHKDALTAAAALTDDTARTAAVKAAQEAFHTAMQDAVTANPALKGVMMPFGGPGGPHGRGGPGMFMKPDMAGLLGMSQDELKAAIASGKTIQDIAKEKGIDLPAPPMHGGRGMFHFGQNRHSSSSQASTQS